MLTNRRNQIAMGLAIAVLALAIISTLLASLAQENESAITQTLAVIGIGLLIVSVVCLAVAVVMIVVKARFHPLFGRATLIVAVAWLPVTIFLQVAINALLAPPSPAGLTLSTILWSVWIVWVFGSIALIVTWLVTVISKRSGKDPAREGSQPPRPSPPGWYPDPAGSGRMRWFDGVVWRDEYGDAP